MNKRFNILVVSLILLIGSNAYFIYVNSTKNETVRGLGADLEVKEKQVFLLQKNLKVKLDSIQKLILLSDKFKSINLTLFDDLDSMCLNAQGFNQPRQFIVDDLKSRSDLIPFEGVMGSSMSILNVILLNYKWAYAYFEDGHIGGYLILEYSIDKNQKIKWEVIRSFLDKC